MPIWFGSVALEDLSFLNKGTMGEAIGIRFKELGDDFLSATMPVDERTKQPAGILHGGASVALAETLGSIAATLCVDRSGFYCVGLDINANHIRSVTSGEVIGTARPLHIGRSTHVWEIRIETPDKKLVCISRLTMAILKREL